MTRTGPQLVISNSQQRCRVHHHIPPKYHNRKTFPTPHYGTSQTHAALQAFQLITCTAPEKASILTITKKHQSRSAHQQRHNINTALKYCQFTRINSFLTRQSTTLYSPSRPIISWYTHPGSIHRYPCLPTPSHTPASQIIKSDLKRDYKQAIHRRHQAAQRHHTGTSNKWNGTPTAALSLGPFHPVNHHSRLRENSPQKTRQQLQAARTRTLPHQPALHVTSAA